ncbi:MAG TPA: VOC family protein [Acidobacteriaceae bacterium]
MEQDLSQLQLSMMLSVRRSAEAVAFYKAAFGAEVLFSLGDPGGSLVVQMRLGQRDFWLAEESPEYSNYSPETLGGGTVRMILTVPDPDADFARAVAAGATVVRPVQDEDYGWRMGRVVDPFGHHWEIGKPLSDGR